MFNVQNAKQRMVGINCIAIVLITIVLDRCGLAGLILGVMPIVYLALAADRALGTIP